MPRKNKEITAYDGRLRDTNAVLKSRPLLLMRSVPFSLEELKVLDTYISRINSQDSSVKTVVFKKSEYEKLMGLKSCKPSVLRSYTRAMLNKTVELLMPNDEYMQFNLFTNAHSRKVNDDYLIELTCSEEAQQLFFAIEGIGYLKYHLSNILNLSSKYSYLLYLYLKDNTFRKSWTVSVDELKNKLDITDKPLYSEFKYIKRDILVKALNEINDKTDINYTYELIKSGRYVKSITFTYHSKELEQLSFNDIVENKPAINKQFDEEELLARMGGDEDLAILADAVKGEFSREEMEELRLLLGRVSTPKDHNFDGFDAHAANIYGKAHYLAEKYAALKTADIKNPIKHRFSYLKKMIEREADEQEISRNSGVAKKSENKNAWLDTWKAGNNE